MLFLYLNKDSDERVGRKYKAKQKPSIAPHGLPKTFCDRQTSKDDPQLQGIQPHTNLDADVKGPCRCN